MTQWQHAERHSTGAAWKAYAVTFKCGKKLNDLVPGRLLSTRIKKATHKMLTRDGKFKLLALLAGGVCHITICRFPAKRGSASSDRIP